jgi:indole-3-glycerol phosphate synthase/phosphoribosylanthranilate isomerase
MLPVGVFRNAPVAVVSDVATLLNLHAVQLHGRENREYVRSLRRELPQDCEIWTALSVGREPLVSRGGDRIVFDNGDGGSGQSFDWGAIKGHPDLGKSVVAGGIGSHNARAAQRLGAHAIDVGSALDARPGFKSPDRIAAFFDAVRPKCRQQVRECA